MAPAPRQPNPVGAPSSAGPDAGAGPSARRALAWLLDSKLCDDEGRVYSWLNPAKPGYVYPEIMGYYVSLCAERGRHAGGQAWLARGLKVARALESLLSPAGGLGRANVEYTFDTGIGLCGLARLDRVRGANDFRPTIARMAEFLTRHLEQGVVAVEAGRPRVDDTRWSESFGASALKTAIALDMASERLGDPAPRELGRRVVRDVLAKCLAADGRICINGERDWVYAHAHAYAVEGLCALAPRGLADSSAILPAAAWIAGVQNADGSITNYHGRPDAELSRQGDATSQAVRIWCAVDARRFAPNIARGLAFLAGLQTQEGGLRYSADSTDVNSWVTMFGAQAALWSAEGADMEWVL